MKELDELQKAVERLHRILQDRQEGLVTWWIMMKDAANEVRRTLPPQSK